MQPILIALHVVVDLVDEAFVEAPKVHLVGGPGV
jgi:hypothetical protein